MLNGAAKVKWNFKDDTQFVSTPNTGLHFIQGRASRGPINQPNKIYNTWEQWVEDYGGLMEDDETPSLVKVLLDGGSSIRFSRVAHYEDITDSETLTATKAKVNINDSTGKKILTLHTKGYGSAYNSLVCMVTKKEGLPETNITILSTTDGNITPESYAFIAGTTLESFAALQNSYLVDVEWVGEAGATATLATGDFLFTGGSDGEEVELTDYIGDSNSLTGLHAFDEYDDSMQLTTFGNYESDLITAANEYTYRRKDLVYYAWLGTGTKNDLISRRNNYETNPYIHYTGGEGIVTDLMTGARTTVNPVADVLNLLVESDEANGPWQSFAGPNRGIIRRYIGLTHNYGTKARAEDLDELADSQINMVINRNGKTMLWGNFSGQKEDTQYRQHSIVRLVLYMKSVIVPTLETFLEEPNTQSTWLRIYHVIKPFLDTLIDKRAVMTTRWEGDQYITDPTKWKVNKVTDVQEGKYRIKLFITAISAIREIEIDLTLSDYSIEFELAA